MTKKQIEQWLNDMEGICEITTKQFYIILGFFHKNNTFENIKTKDELEELVKKINEKYADKGVQND